MSPDRWARVALSRVAEAGSREVWAALQEASPADVWAAVQAGEPLGRLGQRALDGLATRVLTADPAADLARVEALGGRVLCPGDDEWPDGLDWHPDVLGGDVRGMAPPFVLFARGPAHLRTAATASVSVVGARAASPYGLDVAKELARGLAQAGVTVLSGGAYGIDAAAHRGALAAQQAPTVAVLACGLDLAYPRGHDQLLEAIARDGLVLTEQPPGCHVTRMRFLVRNRVVAALTQGTVVVEAAARSGSLSTANRANELGRRVMAVPGPVTSALTTGTHHLIRHGATLVGSVADVLEEVAPLGSRFQDPPRAPSHPRDGLDEDERRVLDAMPVRKPVGIAKVAATAGLPPLSVQAALPELVGLGLVEQVDGGWRLTTLGAS